MIRPALADEIYEPFEYGWVAEENDKVVGHVAVSILSGAPFIHALSYAGNDSFGTASLLIRARKQVRDMGFRETYLNVSCDSAELDRDRLDQLADALESLGFGVMLRPLLTHGFTPVQLILRGTV